MTEQWRKERGGTRAEEVRDGSRLVPLPDARALVNAMPGPLLFIGPGDELLCANPAAENFFQTSARKLHQLGLPGIVSFTSPLYRLLAVVRETGASVNEYEIAVGTPRTGGERMADVSAAPLPDMPGGVVVQIHPRSLAERIDRQILHASAARTITGMAAMLAHEIKNPLSGIRGAAQLLEPALPDGDRELAQLIRAEADRIRSLVEELEALGEERPRAYEPLNIHTVLDHVKKLAEAGFAAGITIRELYDPSLPPVLGDRDRLVQVFINLLKNASEAIISSGKSGKIELSTAYRPGVRVAGPHGQRVALPLEVAVRNTGAPIPEDIMPHIFEPFITSRPGGRGLGLALVARIVRDHGGVVECDREGEWTVFRVRLPLHAEGRSSRGGERDVRGKGEPRQRHER